MKKALKNTLGKLSFFRSIWAHYRVANGYLKDVGWYASFKRMMPIDKNKKPIPWLTYSVIHFLDEKLPQELTVFEYGSGNSTIWFSNRTKEVVSVEHDESWYNQFKPQVESKHNVQYIFKGLESEEYQNEILKYKQTFDIIIIDGRQRVKCAINSIDALTDKGVIIWDNSDREKYTQGYDFLESKGFRRINFWGMGPIQGIASCTSIFYRDKNCLGI